MAKKAFLVGINYPDTDHALRGCVNDVLMTESALTTHFGFDENDIVVLTDNKATAANIKNGLRDLVKDAKAGDILYFHFSGHGSQIPDSLYDTDYEADGMDEILCPIDLDWYSRVVKDDDIREIIKDVDPAVNLTMVLDCCHSGSGTDAESQHNVLTEEEAVPATDDPMKSRQLPMPDHLQERLVEGKTRHFVTRDASEPGVIVTGCQEYQTSADAYINGQWCGAATYHLLEALKTNKNLVTYKTLVQTMNENLTQRGYTQRPQLGGDASWHQENFLSFKEVKPEVVEEEIKPDLEDEELFFESIDDTNDESKKTLLVAGAAIVGFLLIIANM